MTTIEKILADPRTNKNMRTYIKALYDVADEHYNELNVVGGEYCHINGQLSECCIACCINPATAKTSSSKAEKLDIKFNDITIECKQGESRIANFNPDGSFKDATHSKFLAFLPRFDIHKNIEKSIRIVRYDLALDYIFNNTKVVVRGKNRGEPEYVTLKIRFKLLSQEHIDNLANIGFTLDEFKEYITSDHEKIKVDYRKVDKMIIEKWDSWNR